MEIHIHTRKVILTLLSMKSTHRFKSGDDCENAAGNGSGLLCDCALLFGGLGVKMRKTFVVGSKKLGHCLTGDRE